MPNTVSEGGPDKFRRYRLSQRERGLKLLRVWVPDPRTPAFRQEARRQAALLRGAPEERDALDFIEAVADTGDGEHL